MRRPPASLTSPSDLSAASSVTSRFSAIPVIAASAEVEATPCAIWVKRSNSSAANSALDAMKPYVIAEISRTSSIGLGRASSAMASSRLTDLQHHPSLNAAFRNSPHRLRRLLERQHAVDTRV